jgi:hypothetical protein
MTQPQVVSEPGPDQPPAPRRKTRRIWITVAVVAVVVTAVTVVSWYANQDRWADKGQPVAASTRTATPAPTWKPPNMFTHPEPLKQIRYELESRVLTSAGVARTTSSTCDRSDYNGAGAASFTCTVSYDTLKVVYHVSARPKGKNLFEYTATAPQTVITREGLLAMVWEHFGPSGLRFTGLRCEEFPAMVLAPVHGQLAQVCYGKSPSARLTSKIVIHPSDTAKPYLEDVPQN